MQPKQTRRAKLLEAGLQVFFEKGFEKTTIDDIVTEAKCGKGTFYNYFKNKDEMVDALDEKFRIKMTETLAEECPFTLAPKDFFKQLLLTLQQIFRENFRINIIKLSRAYTNNNFLEECSQHNSKFLDECSKLKHAPELDYTIAYIKEKVEKGEIKQTNTRALEACLLGSAYHLRHAELIQKKPYTEEEIEDIVKIILNGVDQYV